MLVVIPAYKRLSTLRLVLRSLFDARVPAGEPMRVLVVTNFPPLQQQIESLVRECHESHPGAVSNWTLLVHHRPRTIDPVDNWYSAIEEFGQPGELVLLHGDDDIFTPWSLTERFRASQESGADVLLSRSESETFFLDDCAAISCPCLGRLRNGTEPARLLGWEDLSHWDGSFIGGHAYRIGDGFRRSLAQAMKWCDEQVWIDSYRRRLMLPFYLPFAAQHVGAGLFGLDSVCVLRGMLLEEYERQQLGTADWNSGFLMLCCVGVLGNADLGGRREIEPMRATLLRNVGDWSLVCLADKRVGAGTFCKTFMRVVSIPQFLRQFRPVTAVGMWLKSVLGVRGYRLSRDCRRGAIPSERFFELLRLEDSPAR